MKRRIFVAAFALCAIASVQGCSPHAGGTADPARAPDGWVAPPRIESAERTAMGLTVRGQVAPQGRVVLRGDGNRAYATGADANGRFELKVQTPTADALFVVETQNGQDAAPAPYRLFVTRDPTGPIALLTPGAPSHRLDGSIGSVGRLDAIDSDGRTLLLSGRARPGSSVALALSGRPPVSVQPSADGVWTAQPGGEGAGPRIVTVDGQTYAYPGLGGVPEGSGGGGGADPSHAGVSVASAPSGWTATWTLPAGGSQSSWFPSTR
ncbi:hypothetical protein BH10PSE2_BH10PSE2_23910 [soil metagenome]